jgi:hypothetical protein
VTPQIGGHKYLRAKQNFRKSPKIAKLEGRVGGDNKYPEMKGTKHYMRNKLPKIFKKIAKLEGRVGGDNKYPIGGHK